MRKALCGLIVVLWTLSAWAEESGPPMDVSKTDRQAIRTVIESQLAAFQRDDDAAAFAHASPSIQGKFRTPEIFMDMVKKDYQPVYRPRGVRFLELTRFRGQPTQRVLVIGPDGVPMMALYPMERQGDGSWKIDGCILIPVEARAL